MNVPWKRIAAWAALIGLSAVFLYAGISKVLAPADFAQAIANYRLAPPWSVNPAALILPWIEVAAAAALWWPAWRRAGALVLLGLSGMFMAAVVSALARGLNIDCGCFGAGAHDAGWTALGIELACAATAAYLLFAAGENRYVEK